MKWIATAMGTLYSCDVIRTTELIGKKYSNDMMWTAAMVDAIFSFNVIWTTAVVGKLYSSYMM